MRLSACVIAAALVFVVAGHGLGRAALDARTTATSSMELLVFEHPGCTYCQVFRRRVVPRYLSSPNAEKAPLRFVDIEKSDTGNLGLASPITILPTVVLIRNGREVDRIAGYWAPANFFKMVSFLIDKAGE
jgi:thioredoxin-related protein